MERMPLLFVGHGSPMNAIEENEFSASWKELGQKLPKPKAILSVSAHWFTRGTLVSDAPKPRMIYDMYGFPEALYKVEYPAPGAPETARKTAELLGGKAGIDTSWGLDHGTWSVLKWLYPKADIPVFQLSVDANASPEEHFVLGQKIKTLREQGVLIFASGNVVHNLGRVNWHAEGGYPWAEAFDGYIQKSILARKYENVIHYKNAGEPAEYAFVTLDHFAPLLYVLGASDENDHITAFNEKCVLGSLSMTSYLFAGSNT